MAALRDRRFLVRTFSRDLASAAGRLMANLLAVVIPQSYQRSGSPANGSFVAATRIATGAGGSGPCRPGWGRALMANH